MGVTSQDTLNFLGGRLRQCAEIERAIANAKISSALTGFSHDTIHTQDASYNSIHIRPIL